MKKISVIIVTYNSEKHINDCLQTLSEYWPTEYKKEILVIDNNSEDKTLNVIKSIRNIKVISNRSNIGFAAAVNQGICLSTGDYVLLLNPDTELKENSLKFLVNCLNEKKYGIVGGATFKLDGEQHGTYVRYPNLLIGLFDFSNLQKLWPNNKWHKLFYYSDKAVVGDMSVDAVGGGYMLIRQDVIQKIGLLDENFFMYLEDIDFCYRARQKGFRIGYCPNSKIIHIGGASSKNKEHINFDAWVKSRSYYFKKHGTSFDNLILQPIFSIDELIMRIKRNI